MQLYQKLASLLIARNNCENRHAIGNSAEWYEKHTDSLNELVKSHMPSGSGFDAGTGFNWDESKPERLVFNTSYHHMTEGSYDGWTEHSVIITPSLSRGFDVRVTGRDRNGIKDYIAETFAACLATELDPAKPDPVPNGLLFRIGDYFIFKDEADGVTLYGMSKEPVKPHCGYRYVSEMLKLKGM